MMMMMVMVMGVTGDNEYYTSRRANDSTQYHNRRTSVAAAAEVLRTAVGCSMAAAVVVAGRRNLFFLAARRSSKSVTCVTMVYERQRHCSEQSCATQSRKIGLPATDAFPKLIYEKQRASQCAQLPHNYRTVWHGVRVLVCDQHGCA